MWKWMWLGAGIVWYATTLIALGGILGSIVGPHLEAIYTPVYYPGDHFRWFFIVVVALPAGMLTALGFGGVPLAFPDRWFHGRLRGLGRIGTALVYAVSLSLAALVLTIPWAGGYAWGLVFAAPYYGLVFYATASVFTPRVSEEAPRLDLWGRIPPILLVSSLLVISSLPAVRVYIRTEPIRTDPSIHVHITQTSFSPDSKWLVTAGWGIAGVEEIKVWDLATKTLAHTIPNALGGVFSRDSQLLTFRRVVEVWERGARPRREPDSRVEVWDLTRRARVRDLGVPYMIGFDSYRATGLTWPKGKDQELLVWDLKAGEVISSVPVPFTAYGSVTARGSQDGRYVALVTNSRKLFIWDEQAGRLMHPDVGGDVLAAKFLDGDKILAVVREGYTFDFFRVGEWTRIESIPEQERRLFVWEASLFVKRPATEISDDVRHHWPAVPRFREAALTSDRRRLVMISDDGGLRLLDTATGAVYDMCKRCFARSVEYLVISPDNQWLAVRYSPGGYSEAGRYGRVSLWNLASRQRAGPLREDRPKDFTDPKQSR